jgi:hypothetical protein
MCSILIVDVLSKWGRVRNLMETLANVINVSFEYWLSESDSGLSSKVRQF